MTSGYSPAASANCRPRRAKSSRKIGKSRYGAIFITFEAVDRWEQTKGRGSVERVFKRINSASCSPRGKSRRPFFTPLKPIKWRVEKTLGAAHEHSSTAQTRTESLRSAMSSMHKMLHYPFLGREGASTPPLPMSDEVSLFCSDRPWDSRILFQTARPS
jgi:hypothetical protein